MKITLAQTRIIWEDKKANIKKAEEIIAGADTDFILFPEMSFTGFSMNTEMTGENGSYTVEKLKTLAITWHCAIGFGWVRKIDALSQNVYTIIDASGNVVSEYVKIHPFSFSGEDKKFASGDSLSIFKLDGSMGGQAEAVDNGIRFANFTCYDLRFPELFRSVADRVSAVIIPANWPCRRSEHWKTLLRARAIENQVYVFAVNCYGDMDGQYYSGDSCIISPDGIVINMLSDREGVIEYEFKDNVEEFRSSFPVLKDRREDLYRKLNE